jgi:hypothetical protein
LDFSSERIQGRWVELGFGLSGLGFFSKILWMKTEFSGHNTAIRRLHPADALPFYEAICESLQDLRPWMRLFEPGFSLADSAAWLAWTDAGWNAGDRYSFRRILN